MKEFNDPSEVYEELDKKLIEIINLTSIISAGISQQNNENFRSVFHEGIGVCKLKLEKMASEYLEENKEEIDKDMFGA